jgi:U3 small nucleolar RNA-associated protein 20
MTDMQTFIFQDQVNDARLDMVNYEAQILELLGKLPSLTEKHGREIIPVFLNVSSADEEDDDEALLSGLKISRRLRQQRLSNYLTLFAHFGNPKALYRAEEVHASYLNILSKGENPLQNLALTCLFTYKHFFLNPYEDNLRGLLTESKFRDELTKFPLGRESEMINPDHRTELLPVVIRILFGIMISKKGRNSSNQGPTARKNAILAALGNCSGDDFVTLIELMLRSFPASVCQRIDLQTGESTELDEVRGRTQIGYLSMEADVLKHLSTQITQFWPTLLSTTLAVTANAQRHIVNEPAGAEPVPEDGEEAPDDEGDDEASALPARTIRNAGLRRLAAFFRAPASFDFSPYMPYLFEHIISPRLALLPQENTQAPSAIMDIFASWSQRPEMYPFLVKYDNRVLSQLFCCIAQPKVKPAVIAHVLDVVDRLLAAAEDEGLNGNIDNLFLAPYMSGLLDNLIICMDGINKVNLSRDDLVKRQISVLPRISPYTQPGEQARKLVALLVPILRKPTKQVSEKVKSDILTTLNAVLVKVPEFSDVQSDFYRQNYNVVSTLFRSLHTRPARQNLVQVLQSFVGADAALQPITDVIASLNAYSTKRMEEPDFDRRLQAFQTLHDLDHKSMSNRLWQPLLYNSLFFLQDPEELTIRSNAGEVIKHYIDTYKVKETCEDREYTITNLVLPGLRDILKSRVELVRAEAVVVIGHAVDKCVGMGVFDELRPLLADGDVEASFFSNVYHLQTHRRARAYRRLVEFVSSGKVRDATISGIFLPILGHVLSGATDKTDHSLVNEAITSIGKLAGKLGWSKYHAAVLSYLRLGTMKGSLQKYYVRAITALLDNFHFDMQQREIDNTEAEIDEGAENDGNEVSHVPVVSVQQSAKIADYVVGKLLPALVRFVQQKDETEDSIRIPVAVGIVKVAMVLPENIREEETGRVITVLSQILRSKDQDTRDLVKDTMCKIALTLGPDWLSRIIREMKASLQRGPQLHVLAVVTHAVLVHVTTEDADRFSSLDDAVADVVSISAEVVWGQSGQDVVAEGFKTKMREVRAASSRGYDSFQLVARLVSPNRVNSILVPLKNIMGETSAVKPMQQVDEALHRIASGLNSNPLLGPIELLRLCHTLISSSAEFLRPGKADNDQQAAIKDDYRVQMKRKILTNEDHYRVNSQKFVGFGLDLFVTAFRRGKFDFGKAEILGRISPLVNAIGNALYSSSDFVLILALKAAAAVTKTPLPAVDNAAPAMIVQIIKIIKRCGGSAVSEVAQVAIRSLAVIVRDCKSAVIKDKQLAYLVEIIGPDLDEHETQAPAFALLRAILSKRFVVPEVYDLMEKVASVMVTSQSTSVQELCRAAMLQFMLDYPQGKGRLKSTMQFLASNLSYVYESGRVSVMELLSHVFNKFSDELVMAYSSLFFLALVIVIANDDSEKCRSMAGELLKQLIGRYDENRLQELVNLLGKWAGQLTEDPALARSSAVVSALAVQSSKDGMRSHINFVIRYLNDILIASSAALERLETQEQVSVFDQVEFDYALPYQALNTMSTCLEEFPDQVDSIEWSAVTPLLIFPHDWVRLASARLLVSRLAKDQTSAKAMDLHDVARKSCLILASGADKGSSRHIPNEKLCGQVVRLLYSIGKQWIVSFARTCLSSVYEADHTNRRTPLLQPTGYRRKPFQI